MLSVTWHRSGFHLAHITHTAAAIIFRIAVEKFPPHASNRRPDPIVEARHRREVTGHQHESILVAVLPQQNHHARFRVSAIDPFKSRGIAIEFVERGLVR